MAFCPVVDQALGDDPALPGDDILTSAAFTRNAVKCEGERPQQPSRPQPPEVRKTAKMEDTDLLEILRSAETDGRVTIGLDPRKLDDVDSPISVQADSTRWIYGLMAAALLVWWLGGATAGAGAIAAAAFIYATIGRRQVERNIRRRFYSGGIWDIRTWRKLWRFEGITLTCNPRAGTCNPRAGTCNPRAGTCNPRAGAEGAPVCRSPDDNWQRFVLDNLAPGGAVEE
jgi:hypothetical protein